MRTNSRPAALVLVFAVCGTLSPQTLSQKPGQNYLFVDPKHSPVTVETGEGEALRPRFHITAPKGWMNDPNGPMEYNNITHIFYQWNPAANVWGAPSWGHVASSDRVHWKRLPVALVPDAEYDVDGVFSGSAGVRPDGTPFLLYTGVSREKELDYYYQVQAAAIAANKSDPNLVQWMKLPTNPLGFELPAGGTHAEFRDPITPFELDGKWWTVIGGQVDCVGAAILYSTDDLANGTWARAGELASQISIGETNGSCPKAAKPSPGTGYCDQMGQQCRAWECPDYFKVDGIYVLKWSDQVTNRKPFAVDWYVVSSVEPDISNTSSYGRTPKPVAFQESELKVMDYGSVYASKSWEALDGRRLWIGWVFETAAGCTQQCSQGTPFTKSLGWQGAQTIPREVTYDKASQTLLFNPVDETAQLRVKTLASLQGNLTDHATPATAGVKTESAQARLVAWGAELIQSELLSNFSILEPAIESNFTFGAVVNFGNGSATIFVNGSTNEDGTIVVKERHSQADVFIDRTKAGAYTNTTLEGGRIPLPASGIPFTDLELHVLFDRSLFEVFALGGRGRVTSRVYPADMLQPSWELSLYGKTSTSATIAASTTVWQMSECWVTDT